MLHIDPVGSSFTKSSTTNEKTSKNMFLSDVMEIEQSYVIGHIYFAKVSFLKGTNLYKPTCLFRSRCPTCWSLLEEPVRNYFSAHKKEKIAT